MMEIPKNLFVFEMANNHQGSVEHGVRIIDAMADIARNRGITAAIKLQYRDLDTFIHSQYRTRTDVAHIPRFLGTRLEDEEYLELIRHTRARGLLPIVTPFDEISVRKCVEQEVPILKVASCSATDWPLLERIAEARRPVIASTGGATLEEIDNLVSFLRHRKVTFALMHCVSIYPTPKARLNMRFLARMKRRYPGVAVGYSGHEDPDDVDVVTVAVACGADLLERHVGVPADGVELNRYSLTPAQADAWVSAALRAREICGSGEDKAIERDERESIRALARGVYARRAIRAGETIQRDDVYFAMPCAEGQTTAGEFGRYRATYTASRDYAPDMPLLEPASEDLPSRIRAIVHEAKGMLAEAQIEFGDDVQIELSHHRGMERFREVGALFVHVVNREYCKKLGVMLPGQCHPRHRHMKKEETFQLLWGDLSVERNGVVHDLKPGDQLLIERGVWHGFSTRGGGIFEEISTTDSRGESLYEDAEINRLDPMQRKTFLETW